MQLMNCYKWLFHQSLIFPFISHQSLFKISLYWVDDYFWYKAKLAKLRRELLAPPSKGGGGGGGEGFDVTKSGDSRVGLVGFPSVGKSTLLNKLTGTFSEVHFLETLLLKTTYVYCIVLFYRSFLPTFYLKTDDYSYC